MPPDKNVTLLPTSEATFGLLDVKFQLPSEFELGGTSVYVFSVIRMDCEEKAPSTGVPWLTRTCVNLARAEKAPDAACEAVIVEVPAPTILSVLPEIVATFVFDEVKTIGAGEFDVGGTMGIVPTPYVVEMIGNGPRIVNVACAGATEATMDAAIANIAVE